MFVVLYELQICTIGFVMSAMGFIEFYRHFCNALYY